MNPADKIKRFEPQGKPYTHCTAANCKEIDQAYLSDVAPNFRSEGGLNRLIEKSHLRGMGLMSGTSMDGLDISVADIDLSETKLDFEK